MTTDLVTSENITLKPKPPVGAGSPVKVLIVSGSLRDSGAESMAVALANALDMEGLEVYFASASGATRDGLDRRIHFLPTDNSTSAPSRVTHELLLYIKHHRFNVIHAHGGSTALLVALAARASHVPSVRVLTHDTRVFRRAPRWVSAPVMNRCADHFVAINPDRQADLESLGIRSDRISVIPAFADVDAVATYVAGIERGPTLRSIGVPEGARVLMMAGPVTAAKRCDNFIRIAAEVARRQGDREVHALVAGEGPDLDLVRRVAEREGAPAKIHFLNYQRDRLRFLAAADVVVLPSERAEALPAFLIEASAAGRPIVCSGVPVHREIVTDGETGRVVSGGIAEYAAATIGLLQHPETGALYAHAAQRRAQLQFDRPAVARATIAVYRNLLNNK